MLGEGGTGMNTVNNGAVRLISRLAGLTKQAKRVSLPLVLSFKGGVHLKLGRGKRLPIIVPLGNKGMLSNRKWVPWENSRNQEHILSRGPVGLAFFA